MNSSLTQKIIIRIILIVLLSMILFTAIGNRMISKRFEEFSFSLGRNFAEQIASQLSTEYENFGDWEKSLEIIRSINQNQNVGKNNSGQKNPGQLPNTPRNINPSDTSSSETPNRPLKQLITTIFQILRNQEISQAQLEHGQTQGPIRGNFQNINRETIIIFNQNKELIFSIDFNNILEDIDPYDYENQWVPVDVETDTVGYVMVGSTAGILPLAQKVLLNQITFLIIIMGLFIGALIILITYVQMRRIINPLKVLSESSLAIADGDLEQHIEIESNDEIGDLANAFNTMAADLKEQQILRKKTTADIAHELRTPLTVMQIDLESIEDGIIEPDKEVLQRLQFQVSHLGNMVNDLRILSLSDAGELVLEKEKLDMVQFLDSFVERMRSLGTEKQIDFEKQFEAKKAYTMIDSKRINQVFSNILHNAMRHSPENSQIIFGIKQENKNILLSIHDQGEGIPKDKIDAIFNRFYRLEEARSRDTGGSGLGLSICKNLVDAHNGKIWAESELGIGTTFYIQLPATF